MAIDNLTMDELNEMEAEILAQEPSYDERLKEGFDMLDQAGQYGFDRLEEARAYEALIQKDGKVIYQL